MVGNRWHYRADTSTYRTPHRTDPVRHRASAVRAVLMLNIEKLEPFRTPYWTDPPVPYSVLNWHYRTILCTGTVRSTMRVRLVQDDCISLHLRVYVSKECVGLVPTWRDAEVLGIQNSSGCSIGCPLLLRTSVVV